MHRASFIRSLSLGAIGTAIPTLLRPLTARAIGGLPTIVFDPAAYAKIVNELTNSTMISANTLKSMEESYQIYNQVAAMNHIGIDTIYPILAQYDQKLLNQLDMSWIHSNQAKGLYDLFQTSFPNWAPAQPYAQLYQIYQAGLQDNIRATTTAVQAITTDASTRDMSLAQIAATKPKTVSEAIEKTNQILNLTTHAITDVRGIMAAQFRDESGYYEEEIQAKKATTGQAGSTFLAAVLGNASDKLTSTPSAQH